MEIQVKIGNRLRELRKATGLSQEKFALECELDRTYIASIEQGKRNVSAVNIEKMANALHISVFEFFNHDLFR
jgi:transcriptional regulator with XRE-family HTH domain